MIGATGRLTGFAGGLEAKARLLALEGNAGAARHVTADLKVGHGMLQRGCRGRHAD